MWRSPSRPPAVVVTSSQHNRRTPTAAWRLGGTSYGQAQPPGRCPLWSTQTHFHSSHGSGMVHLGRRGLILTTTKNSLQPAQCFAGLPTTGRFRGHLWPCPPPPPKWSVQSGLFDPQNGRSLWFFRALSHFLQIWVLPEVRGVSRFFFAFLRLKIANFSSESTNHIKVQIPNCASRIDLEPTFLHKKLIISFYIQQLFRFRHFFGGGGGNSPLPLPVTDDLIL